MQKMLLKMQKKKLNNKKKLPNNGKNFLNLQKKEWNKNYQMQKIYRKIN